jgi:hypothetical protein
MIHYPPCFILRIKILDHWQALRQLDLPGSLLPGDRLATHSYPDTVNPVVSGHPGNWKSYIGLLLLFHPCFPG